MVRVFFGRIVGSCPGRRTRDCAGLRGLFFVFPGAANVKRDRGDQPQNRRAKPDRTAIAALTKGLPIERCFVHRRCDEVTAAFIPRQWMSRKEIVSPSQAASRLPASGTRM